MRGTAAELAARYADGPPKGEIVLVIAPARCPGVRRAGPDGARRAPQAGRRRRPPTEGRHRRRLPDGHKRKRAVPGAHLRVTHVAPLRSRPAARPRSQSRSYGRPMRRLATPPSPRLALSPARRARADAAWVWPVSGEVITPYRNGTDPYATGQHRGIDIAAPVGTPVVAAAGGDVRFAGTAGSSGLTICDPHRRRVRHLVPPPLLARRARRRARVGGRPHRRGRHHRRPLGDRAPPPLRSPRRRHPPRLPRPAGLPATTPATRPRTRPATPSTRPSAPTGTARTGTRHRPAHRPRPHAAPHRRPWRPRAGCRTPRPITGRTPCRTACPTPSAPRAARRSARRPSPAPLWPLGAPAPIGRALPHARGPAFGRTPVGRPHAARRAGDRRLALPGARGRRTASGKADDPASAGGGFDLGWAAACAGLLLAAGLLGMTGGTRRRPPRLPGWAFFLAKWQGKTPDPAQRPRG